MEIKNKTVLLTGASGGIGKELTKQLLEKGAKVVALDVNEATLKEMEKEISNEMLFIHQLDVTNNDSVENLQKDLVEKNIYIDILINNAGIIQPFVSYNEMDEDTITRVMNINFFGPINLVKRFLPNLLKRPEAHIVNVSSMAGFFPFPKQTIYAASKAALKIFTEGLYAELSDTNVHVTAVMPGAINTNIAKNSNVEIKSKVESSKSAKSMSMEADLAATEILNAIEKNAFQVFVGKDSKFMNFLYKMNPKKAVSFINKKMKDLI